MLRRLLTSTLAAGLLAGGVLPAEAAMHATEEFEEGATRPRTIVFLPAQAMLIKKKIVQSEQQLEESGELSGYLAASVEAEFKKQGYEVRVLRPAEHTMLTAGGPGGSLALRKAAVLPGTARAALDTLADAEIAWVHAWRRTQNRLVMWRIAGSALLIGGLMQYFASLSTGGY